MKKNYFLLAASTMMFAACAQTDMVNEVVTEEAPQAIGFDAFANKQTRAEITKDELKKVGFQVWGYKYPSTANGIIWENTTTGEGENLVTTNANIYPVFVGTNVTFLQGIGNDPGSWGYKETQYWDQASKYKFYAIAPIKNNDFYHFSKGNFTIEGVTSNKATESDDYVIASEVEKDGKNHDIVSFTFSHIMSKISFKLKAGVDETITITSLTMSGWDNGVGKFAQGATTEWSIPTSTPTTVGQGTCDILIASDDNENVNDNVTLEGLNDITEDIVGLSYIMVPQTIAANTLTFNIAYEIGGEKFEQEGTVSTSQIWEKNTHYTYTITVSPHAIVFDVTTVNGWQTGTGSTTIE